MRKAFIFMLATASLVMPLQTVQAFERGEALVVFRVVDENDQPVTNADVYCTAWWPDSEHKLGKEYDSYTGKTDTNGLTRVSIVAYHDMRCKFSKEDYYESQLSFVFSGKATPEIAEDRWQPWGLTNDVILKRIRDPIAMYVKCVDAIIPETGKRLGYDLEKGDWVRPQGKGVVSDLVFNVTGEMRSMFDADLQMNVCFVNPQDGIITYTVPLHNETPIGSLLISSHEAPLTGYQSQYTYTRRMRRQRKERLNVGQRKDQMAYFRVRTEVDDEGNIIKAQYGKMYGDLYGYFTDKGIQVSFTYYLNPMPNDRNVEFDPKQNLFLKSDAGYRETWKLPYAERKQLGIHKP